MVIEGETGYLVPSANPEKMAEALGRYIASPDLMLTHGNAGRKRVETLFSMQAMVSGYMRVYDDVRR